MFKWFTHLFDSSWYKALDSAALEKARQEGLSKLRLKGHDLLVICQAESIYVVNKSCPHQGAPLDLEGMLEDGCIKCTRHQMRFPLVKGKGELPLSFYDHDVREGELFVKL